MRHVLPVVAVLVLLAGCGKEPAPVETEPKQAEPAPEAEPEPEPEPEPKKSPLELAEEGCKADVACKDDGRCGAKAGASGDFECVAASVEDCRASSKCKAESACSLDEAAGTCVYASGADCFYSDACLQEGRCAGPKPGAAKIECKSGRKGEAVAHFNTIESEGDFDPDLFRRILRAHSPDFRSCRNKARGSGNGVNGMVLLGWTITLEGDVADLKVLADGLETPVFGECLSEKIAGYRFVKPTDGKPTTLKVGFSFPS